MKRRVVIWRADVDGGEEDYFMLIRRQAVCKVAFFNKGFAFLLLNSANSFIFVLRQPKSDIKDRGAFCE